MRCIQCGKEITQEKAVLCKHCLVKKHSCMIGYKEHTLLICPHCSRYKYNKQWKREKDDAIKEAVLAHCTFARIPEKKNISYIINKKEHNKMWGEATLKTITTLENQNIKEEFVFPIKVIHTLCDSCHVGRTNYFEGILQLRGSNKKVLEDAYNFIQHETTNKNKDGIFINRIEELKNGYDFYYTKQRYLPVIAQHLAEKFGATTAMSPQLFTRRQGKDLYRINAIVRLLDYRVGDIVSYKKKILQVESIGKNTKARDLKTEKLVKIEAKETVLLVPKEEIKCVEVTKHYPQFEVLHPKTFQSVHVENRKIFDEEKAFVVVVDDLVWIVSKK